MRNVRASVAEDLLDGSEEAELRVEITRQLAVVVKPGMPETNSRSPTRVA
jgi:hypothetical protein